MDGVELGPRSTGPAMKHAYNPWLVAVVVATASFMEVLDTSIANVRYRISPATWSESGPGHLGVDDVPGGKRIILRSPGG